MEDTALLTDDEIVALCAADGRPWPLNLPTVDPSAEDLAKAGIRGMRSLMVRRLAGSDAERPGVRPHQFIARDISAFLDARDRIGAYIAPASEHTTMGGAAITAARSGDDWVLDTVTAAGVHAVRRASAEEAISTVLSLAESAYAGTLFPDEESTAWLCVVRFGSDAENLIAVSAGEASGTVDGALIDSWDPASIRGLFTGS